MSIVNPELPYVGEVEGGLTPGKMVKVQGSVPPNSTRFAINYQLGPNLNPRDDIALHISPRFAEGIITRNNIVSMRWGPEENDGPLWIKPGTSFEIIILCEYNCYKIAVNGRHFTEFAHRLPYNKVTHLVIDGEVLISSIFYETIPIGPRPSAPDVPTVDVGPPPPGGLYPTLNPQEKHGAAPSPNPPGTYVYRPDKSEEEDVFGGCLDKVGLAVGGLVAAGGVAAAMHALNKSKQKHAEEGEHQKSQASENESGLGGLGALGAALASSLASNAFDKNAHAQQGYPPSQDMLGSILGALGGGGGSGHSNYQQPPPSDPLSGILGSLGGGSGGGGLGSILGGVLGGGGSSGGHQPQYQPSGGYGNYPQQNQGSQGGDLLGGLLGAALDGLSKHSQKSHHDSDNGSHYSAPPPSANYGHYESHEPSHPPARPPSPPPPGGGKLSAAEISRGLGLGDDED